MIPARSSSLSRLERSAGEQVGIPRRISLNRVLPTSSSRRMSGVQRWQITSAALDTGQNWPYPSTSRLYAALQFLYLSRSCRRPTMVPLRSLKRRAPMVRKPHANGLRKWCAVVR